MAQRPLDPDDPAVIVSLRLPGKVAARLKRDAAQAGESVSTYLRGLLEAPDADVASGPRDPTDLKAKKAAKSAARRRGSDE